MTRNPLAIQFVCRKHIDLPEKNALKSPFGCHHVEGPTNLGSNIPVVPFVRHLYGHLATPKKQIAGGVTEAAVSIRIGR